MSFAIFHNTALFLILTAWYLLLISLNAKVFKNKRSRKPKLASGAWSNMAKSGTRHGIQRLSSTCSLSAYLLMIIFPPLGHQPNEFRKQNSIWHKMSSPGPFRSEWICDTWACGKAGATCKEETEPRSALWDHMAADGLTWRAGNLTSIFKVSVQKMNTKPNPEKLENKETTHKAFCRTHKCAEAVRSLQLQQHCSCGRKKLLAKGEISRITITGN